MKPEKIVYRTDDNLALQRLDRPPHRLSVERCDEPIHGVR